MAAFPWIDPSLVSERDRQSVITEFDIIMTKEPLTIYDQLKTRKLEKLDSAILRAIGIKDFETLLDNLYFDLLHELDKTEIDDDAWKTCETIFRVFGPLNKDSLTL